MYFESIVSKFLRKKNAGKIQIYAFLKLDEKAVKCFIQDSNIFKWRLYLLFWNIIVHKIARGYQSFFSNDFQAAG